MKKNVLLAALVIPICLLGQNKKIISSSQPSENTKVKYEGTNAIDNSTNDSANLKSIKPNANNNYASAKRGIIDYSFIKLGTSTYDLQTNASMGSRIILLPNGNISAVWTNSSENSTTYNDRGTGYNNFNGTSWFTPESITSRVESSRTGWPSIGFNGSPANEWIMGHTSTNSGGFIKSTNTEAGSRTWTSSSAVLTQVNRRPIWGRAANNGNIFHMIACYADSAAAGEKRAPTINGIMAPFTYSRSTDGGTTWSTQHILLPGYDSFRYVNGAADRYAIDVKDSIVAIVYGDLYTDVALWKSTDNGVTFNKTIMDSLLYAPFRPSVVIPNREAINTCDGSLSVVIDNNGKVHCSWGVTRIAKPHKDTGFFYPSTALLKYWNENTQKAEFIAGGSQFPVDPQPDLNFGTMSDTTWSVYPGTWQAKPANVRLEDGTSQPVGAARTGNTSLLHMPSIGIDASNNIFISFSLPVAGDVDPDYCNFRDVMLVHSTDNGTTWANPINVTKREQKEDDFPSIAKTVNGFVHLLFQSDDITGTNLQNDLNGSKPISSNEFYYAAIPVSKILDGSIGNSNLNVKSMSSQKEVFIVSQNQPNPFNGKTDVIIWLENTSDVNIEITNISGQVVSTQKFDDLGLGNHQLTINGENLSSGIYFYTVRTGTHSVTQKMIVQ